jgi:hypothetical protein
VIRRIRGHYTDESDVVDCEADDPRAGGWFVERWALDHRARGHWKRDHESLNTMDEAIISNRSRRCETVGPRMSPSTTAGDSSSSTMTTSGHLAILAR